MDWYELHVVRFLCVLQQRNSFNVDALDAELSEFDSCSLAHCGCVHGNVSFSFDIWFHVAIVATNNKKTEVEKQSCEFRVEIKAQENESNIRKIGIERYTEW